MKKLAQENILITGAASGIGEAAAVLFVALKTVF
jgi:NAD(P)-dependent dehydrogenase (short-subunit alcohol dehydrogenase family)